MFSCPKCGCDLLYIYNLQPYNWYVCTNPECTCKMTSEELKGADR
jgi:ssDNA-binding Zn-finger/Zn-ribbon topoisomerase 1